MKKSASELELLRRAIAITLEGEKAAAGAIASDRWEYQVQAALEYQFRQLGSSAPAFPSIVGSGINSTTLHYESNSRKMMDGELVVVDIGAEFSEYAADITRTYPVSGKFSPRQREIYNIVLEAQEAALKEVRPGAGISRGGAIHKASFDYINAHGKDLRGQPLGQYFIHGTSHHLGLDVHDAVDENSRPLEQGMVITVEPGIYIPEEKLGVRIEDDVLVTETGYELLSRDLPRRAEEVERFMADSRKNLDCH
jgi:Xaa-Pro aminopeptidase